MGAFSSHKVITFFAVSLPHECAMETNYEDWLLHQLYGSTKQEVHLYFHPLTNVQDKNSPEVEKSSGPFETSLKETSLDFPNKASLWRGKSTFSPCWWKNRHPNETEHAQTTLTFIKEILTLNDK